MHVPYYVSVDLNAGYVLDDWAPGGTLTFWGPHDECWLELTYHGGTANRCNVHPFCTPGADFALDSYSWKIPVSPSPRQLVRRPGIEPGTY